MHLGRLVAGEPLSVRVSDLSAAAATPSACVGPAVLTESAALPEPDGLGHAPIFKWPVQKRFDDLPVVVGWSSSKLSYEAVYSNENGGTVALCGGAAYGIQAEMARWGRAVDIEGMYRVSGSTPQWERCTGMTSVTAHAIAMEGDHPILYYGDGHNRLFESRGGYGQTCGTGSDAKADGDLSGWNLDNPGNGPEFDAPYVVVLRPLPVSLDALGYADFGGRREGLVDGYAPWLYRVVDGELRREGKIDGQRTFGMQQYLYADIYAADVGGAGDSYCSLLGVNGGFKLRVQAGGNLLDSGQMTAEYFGGANAVKRMVVPLDQIYAASDFSALVLDAYDNDGVYWLALGDLFVPRPAGDNGATIDLVHAGKSDVGVYVDDDDSGCVNGVNSDGPSGPMQCVGSFYQLGL